MKRRSAREIAKELEEKSRLRIIEAARQREQRAANKKARRKAKLEKRALERAIYGKKPKGERRHQKNRFQTHRGFYSSQAWLEIRHRVLVHYGPKCMLCNATREDGVKLHVDHIKPRARYPHLELEFSNLQILCEDCNIGKQASDMTDWRPKSADVEIETMLEAMKRL